LESPLQKCPQRNGQYKSPLLVLTGGPQDLAVHRDIGDAG
jgi:hypothetical protein